MSKAKQQITTVDGIEINETTYEDTVHIELPDSPHYIAEHTDSSINYFKLNYYGDGVGTSIRFDEVSRKGDHEYINNGFNFAREGHITASIHDEELSEEMIGLLESRYC